MSGFRSVKEFVDAENNGQTAFGVYQKSVSVVAAIGSWFDLSMSIGIPDPQYYANTPMQSAYMTTSSQLYIGGTVAPAARFLKRSMLMQPQTAPLGGNHLVGSMILCDYLMYYPFLDDSIPTLQNLVNTLPLPRYTSGYGVQIMPVTLAGRVGGKTFQVTYTNSSGVSGRVTQVAIQAGSPTQGVGNISTSGQVNILGTGASVPQLTGPFLTLQAGDTGVQSIQSFQMISGTDVGLSALVLVKPLCTTQIYDSNSATEVDYMTAQSQMQQVYDGAYLNYVTNVWGQYIITYPIVGMLQFVWN